MQPGSNAIKVVIVSEKCTGLLIPEDHPGLTQLGQAALFPSDKNSLDRLVLSQPPFSQFIFCVRVRSLYVNGRQLHAIVDLSRRLGYSC